MKSRLKAGVGIAEMRVMEAPGVLVAYGLGSCLGVLLYDRERCLGGLAHTLLPGPPPEEWSGGTIRFVDSAIRLMIGELSLRGADKEELTAGIIGGANMFQSAAYPGNHDGIGARNVRAARETLRELGISLAAEETGGNIGRTVEFDLTTGNVSVRSVGGGDRIMII